MTDNSTLDAADAVGGSCARPLAGEKFIERSAFVAAPIAGKTLSQLGADVVRVDDLRGAPDWDRWPLSHSGRSLYWAELNRGKKSVLVDTRNPAGRELIAELAVAAGGYLTNLDQRPPVDPDGLRRRRPDLVYLAICGSRDGRTAVDYTVNAALGHPYLLGPTGYRDPINHQLPAWDLTAGLMAAVAVASAVAERRRTGAGATAITSLMDVAVALTGSLGMLAEAQLGSSRTAPAAERAGNVIYGAFGRDFTTQDQARVMVAAVSQRQWRALLEATQTTRILGDLATQLGRDFDQPGDRYACAEAIAGVLALWFASHPLTEVTARLTAAGACWDLYQDMQSFVENDERSSLGNPLMSLDEDGEEPGLRVAGFPVDFRGLPSAQADVLTATPTSPLGPRPEASRAMSVAMPAAPRPGQHTDEVLAQALGLTQAELGRLHDERVVA